MFGKEMNFTVSRDMFTDEIIVMLGNLEARFNTQEEALAFIANEMRAELR